MSTTSIPQGAVAPDDAMVWADMLAHAISALELDQQIAHACPHTWALATAGLRSSETADQRVGYRLLLTALADTPNAAHELIVRLEQALAGRA